MESLDDKVLEILAAKAKPSEKEVTLDTPIEETGIDSLSMIEIIFELEEAFDIEIPDPATVEERTKSFQTPRDVAAMVRALLDEKSKAE